MLRPFQILLILLFGHLSLIASENRSAGARPLGLSNAFVSISDPWSTFHNQATLASLKTFSGGVFYESKFLVDELSLAAGTINLPALRGIVGFSFYQIGQGSYKESKIGLAYSKQLSENLNAALQFDYFINRFPENDKAFGFPTFEIGLAYHTTEELTLGIHLFNPVKNGFKTYSGKEEMPIILRLGGHYEFSDRVLLSAEIQKDSYKNALVKTGIEFLPLENLAIRFGVSGRPLQYTAGIGYIFGKFTTDIAFSYHGNLGFSPSVSMHFNY